MLSSFDDLQALAYADHVSLVCHGDTKAEALAKLQLLLDKAYAWSVANRLCLNPSKCVSIIFPSMARKLSESPTASLRVGEPCIQNVMALKILGVTLSSDLSWRDHTRAVCSKLSRILGFLRRFGGSLETKTRSHVYEAYIKPDLDYCLPVWGNHSTAQATAVNKLLTKAKRVITRNNSTKLSNFDYNLFCISDFNNIVFLAVVYQIHRCMYGDLQCSDFNKLSQVHATRASISMKCVTDRNRKCCDNSFTFAASKLWNRLLNSINCISNFNVLYVSAFKHIFK